MKKKLILLLAAVLVLASLMGLYIKKSRTNAEGESPEDNPVVETTQPTQTYTLMDRAVEDIAKVVITSYGEEFIYLPKDESFTLVGYENVQFNKSNIESVIKNFSSLYSTSVVVDNPEDLGVYGLAEPSAVGVVEYKDGTNATLNLGSVTPDKNYYYAMVTGDTNVYLLDVLSGNRLHYGVAELIDKNITSVSQSTISYIKINQRDKEEIEITYDENNASVNENLQENGLFTLIMVKPLKNVLVYPYNLQNTLLSNLPAITIKDVADAKPQNLADYGLDNPLLVVELKDSENSLKLTAGNYVDEEENVYVMINDRPEVFVMNKQAISSFLDVNITDFIQKFVALHTRISLNNIEVTSTFGDFKIEIKEEGENKIELIDGTEKDMRSTYVNNNLIDRKTFTDFYELLIGLSFDSIDETATATGNPDVTIKYVLSNGIIDMVEFYAYNENFYIAKKGEDSSMIVSKQNVKQVIDKGLELGK